MLCQSSTAIRDKKDFLNMDRATPLLQSCIAYHTHSADGRKCHAFQLCTSALQHQVTRGLPFSCHYSSTAGLYQVSLCILCNSNTNHTVSGDKLLQVCLTPTFCASRSFWQDHVPAHALQLMDPQPLSPTRSDSSEAVNKSALNDTR